ncbi:MAG: pilus assembly protein TadG-related protein [Alphaproteobacteria bacterium]|nr:pilus assembly protein TadG-related protein [Alphaproteobacteria bacterium]
MWAENPNLEALRSDQRGGVLLPFALSLSALLGICALAVDAGFLYVKKAELQNAADAAALAAVIDLPNEGAAHGAAMRFAIKNMSPSEHGSVLRSSDISFGQWDNDSRIFTPGVAPADAVKVTTRRAQANGNPAPTFFARILGFHEVDVVAETVAAAAEPGVCILALDPDAVPGFDVSNGTVAANGCSVHVNATDPEALEGSPNGSIVAEPICVSGGHESAPDFTPVPDSNCPQLADPLASLEPPVVGLCDHNNFKLTSGDTTIDPGVYCHGLEVSSTANVTLNPGLYIIKDGQLRITGSGSFSATGVMFYITGADAFARVSGSGTVTLTAPITGTYAGVLFFGDRALPTSTNISLKGGPSFHYEGSIYFPTSNVIFSGTASASSPSPYTIIIARSYNFNGSGEFVVNSNYDASAVPLPAGLGPQSTRLVM